MTVVYAKRKPEFTKDIDDLAKTPEKDHDGNCEKIISFASPLIEEHKRVITSLIVVILTVGIELIVHRYCFKCTCHPAGGKNRVYIIIEDHNFVAGMSFLTMPAGFLFSVGESVLWILTFEQWLVI